MNQFIFVDFEIIVSLNPNRADPNDKKWQFKKFCKEIEYNQYMFYNHQSSNYFKNSALPFVSVHWGQHKANLTTAKLLSHCKAIFYDFSFTKANRPGSIERMKNEQSRFFFKW